MTIHREGRPLLLTLFLVLISLNVLLGYFLATAGINLLVGFFSVAFFLLILQFFRSPLLNVSANEKQVLAPADGKVVVIEETEESEYFKGKRRQVSIFMSPLNVHVNRMPVEGRINYYRYHPGKYRVAWHPKSSEENERTTLVATMKNGTEILFRQIAGALARRIKCYVKENDSLKQGEEFGFIKFGSRVDVFLPLEAVVSIKLGEKTQGGKTVIAELV